MQRNRRNYFAQFPKRMRAPRAGVVRRERCERPPHSPTAGTGGPSPAPRLRHSSATLRLPDWIFSRPMPGWLTQAPAPRAGGDTNLPETQTAPRHFRGAAEAQHGPGPAALSGEPPVPRPRWTRRRLLGTGPACYGSGQGVPGGRAPRRGPRNPTAPTSYRGNFFYEAGFFLRLPSISRPCADILPRLL
ncbi:uncharacterized protein LOC126653035 isoform X1 [Myiozetetes cayanensis]|uniref:uncharacterized protein LOC126653035 isoform X1 n=1 Tax=Myiozetetes cayanensis TaxID=478635 RepID=UPI00215E275D|nr:uncharacterized protein LOC126653035 isoform X1 [Myiozetetes cayanensis]